MKLDCSILVPSCDAYSDVWPVFLHGFRTHWPDCPFPVYFGTNEIGFVDGRVTAITSAQGLVWSNRLLDYLYRVQSKYILLLLEDFILRRNVNSESVLSAVQFCEDHAAACVRLVPRPPPATRRNVQGRFSEIYTGESYRISTQAAVWRREYLLQLLRKDESIWDFEMRGTVRSSDLAGSVWSVDRPILPYEGLLAHHVIEKGRWIPHERWILRLRGYPVTGRVRPSMSLAHVLSYQFGETLVRMSRVVGERRIESFRRLLRRAVPAALLRWYSSVRNPASRANEVNRRRA